MVIKINKKPNKLVSIIIPVYNSSKYIEDCLLSVINQSYCCIEVILIDDGSTDDSVSLINKYKDKVILLENGINQGISYSRNRGIDISTGEYMCFWDSDDTIPIDALEKMIYSANNENADLVIGIKQRKGIDLNDFYYKSTLKLASKHTIQKEDNNLFYNFSISNKLFKTEIIKQNNIRLI